MTQKKKKPSNSNAAERKTVPSNFAPTGAGLQTKLEARPWLTPMRTQLGRRRWRGRGGGGREFFSLLNLGVIAGRGGQRRFSTTVPLLCRRRQFSPPRLIGPQRCPACEPVNPESEGDEEGGKKTNKHGNWRMERLYLSGRVGSKQTDRRLSGRFQPQTCRSSLRLPK